MGKLETLEEYLNETIEDINEEFNDVWSTSTVWLDDDDIDGEDTSHVAIAIQTRQNYGDFKEMNYYIRIYEVSNTPDNPHPNYFGITLISELLFSTLTDFYPFSNSTLLKLGDGHLALVHNKLYGTTTHTYIHTFSYNPDFSGTVPMFGNIVESLPPYVFYSQPNPINFRALTADSYLNSIGNQYIIILMESRGTKNKNPVYGDEGLYIGTAGVSISAGNLSYINTITEYTIVCCSEYTTTKVHDIDIRYMSHGYFMMIYVKERQPTSTWEFKMVAQSGWLNDNGSGLYFQITTPEFQIPSGSWSLNDSTTISMSEATQPPFSYSEDHAFLVTVDSGPSGSNNTLTRTLHFVNDFENQPVTLFAENLTALGDGNITTPIVGKLSTIDNNRFAMSCADTSSNDFVFSVILVDINWSIESPGYNDIPYVGPIDYNTDVETNGSIAVPYSDYGSIHMEIENSDPRDRWNGGYFYTPEFNDYAGTDGVFEFNLEFNAGTPGVPDQILWDFELRISGTGDVVSFDNYAGTSGTVTFTMENGNGMMAGIPYEFFWKVNQLAGPVTATARLTTNVLPLSKIISRKHYVNTSDGPQPYGEYKSPTLYDPPPNISLLLFNSISHDVMAIEEGNLLFFTYGNQLAVLGPIVSQIETGYAGDPGYLIPRQPFWSRIREIHISNGTFWETTTGDTSICVTGTTEENRWLDVWGFFDPVVSK